MRGRMAIGAGLVCAACNLSLHASATAQEAGTDDIAGKTAAEPSREAGSVVFDILDLPPSGQSDDAIAARECEDAQDAARIAGQIVVCRSLGTGAEDAGFDKADWERRYAQRTQGPVPVDVEGAGGSILYRALGSVFMVTVAAKMGDPPEPTLFIDVEALPQAPPGSDADRMARGLPPQQP